MAESDNTLVPTAKPARARTLHKVTDAGELRFDIVPYLIGDRVQVKANAAVGVGMEGAVTAYDGHTVTLKIDKAEGSGKFDDWTLSLVQSAIPAPISPDETEATRVAVAAALDPVGGAVVCDFARALIELVRTMDDERDLLHYLSSIRIVSQEPTFNFRIELQEKNCELSEETREEMAAAMDNLRLTGPHRLRHLDLKPVPKE